MGSGVAYRQHKGSGKWEVEHSKRRNALRSATLRDFEKMIPERGPQTVKRELERESYSYIAYMYKCISVSVIVSVSVRLSV